MKRFSWMQIAVAALLVIVGGAAIVFAEAQTVKLKVMKTDTETVEVDVNGDVEVVALEDLADGEERSFAAGEHTITVRRDGDQLTVLMDGEDFASVHGVGEGCHGGANMVWVTEGGLSESDVEITGDGALAARKVMVVKADGDHPETRVIKINCEDDADCEHLKKIDIETLHSEHGEKHVFIHAGGDGYHHGEPIMLEGIVDGEHSKARFRCAEDGTELSLKKENASQETYLCPVCGREMDKLASPQIRVMTIEVEETQETE